jgi:hypothetical protein
MDNADTVPLSRKWLSAVFWLALGVVFGLLCGCSALTSLATTSSEDVYVCLVTPKGDQCYKIKDYPSKIEMPEASE